MIKTERKEVTTTKYEYVPVKGICDGCGKEFEKKTHYTYGNTDCTDYDYYRVVTNHHNWGNDSVDSYEASEFCSVGCLMEFVEAYWMDKRKCDPCHMTHEMEIRHMDRLESYD